MKDPAYYDFGLTLDQADRLDDILSGVLNTAYFGYLSDSKDIDEVHLVANLLNETYDLRQRVIAFNVRHTWRSET